MLCPCCGSIDFYLGFTAQECKNPECTLYPKKKEEEAKAKKPNYVVGLDKASSGGDATEWSEVKVDLSKLGFEKKDWKSIRIVQMLSPSSLLLKFPIKFDVFIYLNGLLYDMQDNEQLFIYKDDSVSNYKDDTRPLAYTFRKINSEHYKAEFTECTQ